MTSFCRRIEPSSFAKSAITSNIATASIANGDLTKKLAMGKGLCVLFAGPSGTGKTMSADIIAGELGLDLYKIDLSNVVSKYIGETEKNLSRIFDEAETSNAILFFDEADALFGKRSEVKDSHDRYANIETGYLLQRMEEHEGIVILASNFRKNMDEAFIRRLHFTVEFPFPNEEDRLRIWENVWPETAPRDPGLDFAFLARRFQITGGNIRNMPSPQRFWPRMTMALSACSISSVQLSASIRKWENWFPTVILVRKPKTWLRLGEGFKRIYICWSKSLGQAAICKLNGYVQSCAKALLN